MFIFIYVGKTSLIDIPMNYIRKTMSRAAFGSSTLFTPARVKREMGSMIKDPQIRERERERQTAPPYIRKQTYSYMLVTWIVGRQQQSGVRYTATQLKSCDLLQKLAC